MTAGILLRYLFGQAEAIRQLAATRAWWPLGVALVLLTAFPRNYDQTWIGEKPFLWFFGPLLFSLGSGSLLFAFLQLGVLWRRRSQEYPHPSMLPQWASFMGLFWLTAPIAWLYALPVERFLDPLAATKANLALLGIVALWRVLLMARVVNVVNHAPFLHSLVWVLFPAALEVLGVVIFGGTLSKQIMAGMAGMRNSPEESLMLRALGNVGGIAFYSVPILLLIGGVLLVRLKPLLRSFPNPSPRPTPWLPLLLCLSAWVAVTIPAQQKVRHNVTVEALAKGANPREVLDYLAARQPGDFAPSRPLPPKAFEGDVFERLPPLLGAVQTNDPPWVQAHLMQRFREMCVHLGPSPWQEQEWPNWSEEKRREEYRRSLDSWQAPDAHGWVAILRGLERMPAGQAWRETNATLLTALAEIAAKAPESKQRRQEGKKDYEQTRLAWKQVTTLLETVSIRAPSEDPLPTRSSPPP